MAPSDAASPVSDSDERYMSPWSDGFKASSSGAVPTFNLHTTSISTLYQSDSEFTTHSPCGSFSSEACSRPTAHESFENEAVLSQGSSTKRGGATIDARLLRVEHGLRANGALNGVLRELSSIGADYASRLQALADGMEIGFEGESRGMSAAVGALRAYIVSLAENQREFADAVAHECTVPNDTPDACAGIRGDLERARSKYDAAEASRTSLVAGVENLYLQTKSAVSMCSEAFHEPPSVKTRLHAGLISVFLKFMRSNGELSQSQAVNARVELDEETARLSESLRSIDADRVCGLRDGISKLVVYETARLRNLQYDVCHLVTALNDVDPEREWSEFEATGHQDMVEVPSESSRSPTHYATYLKAEIPEVFRNYAVSQLALSAPKERVLQRIERTLAKYIDAVWDDKADSVQMADFVGEMQSSLVRQVFCNLVTTRSLQCNRLPSMAALKLFSRLVGALLAFSRKQGDAWTGYAILKLADFVHVIEQPAEGQPRRTSLRWLIYSHEYWSRIPFWEECLLIAIAQDFAALFEDVRPDTVLKPYTSELLRFRHWMAAFGISSAESCALIERVCGRLGLPGSYTQCLQEPKDS
ncbi:hypothetical protein, conserved [Babesia bigemina]|uniref:Uncharacterized protein n=1 Tax=Babesia bigemina TaxID=5866 RepID=A0A061DBR4_BABBI|nr:hypothetical protein, conserved [Babesia bigemina]CDR97402.1 hypothetical protein, conserved [Babesia bigemina]|eukprot:XP_012769588.1 hypothetical protein, conserved [Babesia bigemina]